MDESRPAQNHWAGPPKTASPQRTTVEAQSSSRTAFAKPLQQGNRSEAQQSEPHSAPARPAAAAQKALKQADVAQGGPNEVTDSSADFQFQTRPQENASSKASPQAHQLSNTYDGDFEDSGPAPAARLQQSPSKRLNPESRRLQQLAALVATEQALEEELQGLDASDEELMGQLPPEIAAKLRQRQHKAAGAAHKASRGHTQRAAHQPSGRHVQRKNSKHLAHHDKPWMSTSTRPGLAASWDSLHEEVGQAAAPEEQAVQQQHHYVQEPTAMYNRTQQFKQKVAQRYNAIRQAREEELANKCTFHPKINNLSRLLLESLAQGWNPASPRSTHVRSPRARSEFEDPDQEQEKEQPLHLTAAERLYNQAMDSKARVREAAQLAIQEELDSYLAATPRAQKLSSSIYGLGSESRVDVWRTHPLLPPRPKNSPYNLSGLDECTFHPHTNWSRVLEGQTSDFHHMKTTPNTWGATEGRADLGSSFKASQDDLDVGDRFGLSVNLDFAEFLNRQQRFIQERDRKLSQEAAQHAQRMSPQMAPGSKRILARYSQSPTPQEQEYRENSAPPDIDEKALTGLERFASMSSNFGRGKRQMAQQVLAEEAMRMTFHPQILRKSSARPARSWEEMSEGDRLRREVWVEQMKLQRLAAEQQEMTFKPSTNRTGTASRINMRNPATYLQTVKARNESRAQQAQDQAQQRMAKELAECTFKPKTRAIPAQVYRVEHVETEHDADTRSETGYSEHHVAVM